MRRSSLFILLSSLPVMAQEWKSSQSADLVPTDLFHPPAGMEVSVWATSPMLYNPTCMDVDQHGRIWVAEGVNYRGHRERRPEGDRIVILSDVDGDGKAEHSQTFVQDKALVAPLGVAVFDNVVVVSQPPDLLVYTDVNRNGVFEPDTDKREVLLTGFNARNHDHSLHSITAGPDGKWYLNNGNCGAMFTDRSGKTFRMGGDYYKSGGGDWFIDTRDIAGKKSDDGFLYTAGFSARMNADGSGVEIIGHGYRNSYEHCTTSFGDLFQNDNDDPPACRTSYVLEGSSAGYFTREGRFWNTVQRAGQDHGRAHWRQDDPGTFDVGDIYGGGSPTGITFYENGSLGDNWVGTLLSCEAARNVIFGYQPVVKGATYQLDRKDFLTTNTTGQFSGADFTGGAKTNENIQVEKSRLLFRPSDVLVGADGALYVSDWFDPRVGGHSDQDESCSGTIYRIAPKGFKPNHPKVDMTSTAGLVQLLSSPAVNVRYLGFTGLKQKGADALPAVQQLLKHPNRFVAARAIWLLPYMGKQGLASCEALLKSPNEMWRLTAYRAIRRAGIEILPYAKRLCNDASAAVRRDVALSLRGKPLDQSKELLVKLAQQVDPADKNAVEAIGLAAENVENDVWLALKEAMVKGDASSWSPLFTKLTWRLWPSAAVADLGQRATSQTLSREQQLFALESLTFIDSMSAVDRVFLLALENPAIKTQVEEWLRMRGTGSWAKFGISERLKSTGVYDPDAIVINEIKVPEKPAAASFTEAQVAALKGDAEKGKVTATRCAMCHQIENAGPDYAPSLRGWVARQGVDNAIKAIVNPSADIAHGFSGSHIVMKDGKQLDGLVLSSNDPIAVVSTGGVRQLVPKKRVAEIKTLDRSLMLSADQLGLTAQDVADVVAWLKTYQ